jgi:hypothetical protein
VLALTHAHKHQYFLLSFARDHFYNRAASSADLILSVDRTCRLWEAYGKIAAMLRVFWEASAY